MFDGVYSIDMEQIELRKQVYLKISNLKKQGVDLYMIFDELNIMKTKNMYGYTVNLSAIPVDEIHMINNQLKNVSHTPLPVVEHEQEVKTEYVTTNCVTSKPKYNKLKLTKLQKLILTSH
jgi:hypothetical protein